jgi:hypothetical protein
MATQIQLSDGRTAEIRKFKGRDMVKAQKLAGKDTEMIPPYVCAMVTTIDGKPVMVEHLLDEMEGEDYLKILGEAMGEKGNASLEAASSPS